MGVLFAIIDAVIALVLVAVSLPLLRRKIPMNTSYGARTFLQAFQSEDAWYDINEYTAKQIIRWSILLVAAAFVNLTTFFLDLSVNVALPVAMVGTVGGLIVAALGSYFATRRYVYKRYPLDKATPHPEIGYTPPPPGETKLIFYALGGILLMMLALIVTIVLLASHYGGNLSHNVP
jgi:hypothetical protein